MVITGLSEHVEHFRVRVLQDALAEATSSYWLRRARAFTDAMPKPTDYIGRATTAELAARAARLEETALACEHAAELALRTSDVVGCGCADDPPGEHP